MSYGRDYGNRNFLERAAHTVRGWIGNRGGGGDGFYDDEFRGGGMNRGYDRGYREMGDVSGYGGGAMRGGYGATNWRGYNDDWNRGPMGGGYRGGGEGYRTGGYQPGHGSWDVDWDDSRSGGYGMDRGMNRSGMDRGYTGGGMDGGYGSGGYTGGGYGGGGERDHYMGRDFMTNHPHFGHDWQSGHLDDASGDMNRGGGWDRPGGMMGRGTMGGMNRGMQGGTDRDRDDDRGDWNRGGMDRGMGGGGMLGREGSMGDVSGGTIGNYGAYGSYGLERFRSASGGGVSSGQYFRGYGVGSGYRP
jgi:hypothetical protein